MGNARGESIRGGCDESGFSEGGEQGEGEAEKVEGGYFGGGGEDGKNVEEKSGETEEQEIRMKVGV